MNATEQRDHKTALDKLSQRIDKVDKRFEDLAAACDDEVAERMTELRKTVERLITEEKRTRIAAALHSTEYQRRYVDDADEALRVRCRDLDARLGALLQLTFWQRVRWIVTGEVVATTEVKGNSGKSVSVSR